MTSVDLTVKGDLGAAGPASSAPLTNPRTIPLPLDINLLRLASRVTGRGSGMLQRLTHDLVADNAPLVERLGISPRAFRPGPDCWQPSAS